MGTEVKEIINCGRRLSAHVGLDELGKPIGISEILKSEVSPCSAEPENTPLNTSSVPECNLLGCPYNLDGDVDSKKIVKYVDFPDPDSFPRS